MLSVAGRVKYESGRFADMVLFAEAIRRSDSPKRCQLSMAAVSKPDTTSVCSYTSLSCGVSTIAQVPWALPERMRMLDLRRCDGERMG